MTTNAASNETTSKSKTETQVLWSLTDSMPLAIALLSVIDKAERAGKGGQSVQYWAEELLSRGCETYSNYLDADKKRRDAVKCEAEISAIPAPPPLDFENVESLKANAMYAERVKSIRRKFGIGSEKKQL